jgi:hypothetical protein
MLGQHLDSTIDCPIYYASWLMTSVENNYTRIEKEALTMIYVIKNIYALFTWK